MTNGMILNVLRKLIYSHFVTYSRKDTMVKLSVLDLEHWRGAEQWRQTILQQEEHEGSKHCVCSSGRRVKATGYSSIVIAHPQLNAQKKGDAGRVVSR